MAKKDEFLSAYFSDCQAEMRWRREVEYKLLASLIPLSPALVAGLFALSTLVDRRLVAGTSVALTAFVWILHSYVGRKVRAEHKIYEGLGEAVVKIWEYFELFVQGAYVTQKAILSEGSRSYGKGEGYRLTLNVLSLISVVTTVMLLGIGAFAFRGELKTAGSWSSEEALRQAMLAVRAADPNTTSWTIHSLEPRGDRKGYAVIVLREDRDDGYVVALQMDTRTVIGLQATNVRDRTPTGVAMGITEVQERLHLLGYYRGDVDGKKGPLTASALKRFQRNHNLDVTGEPDLGTLRSLVKYTAAR